MSSEKPKYATFRDLHLIRQTGVPQPTDNPALQQASATLALSDQPALSAQLTLTTTIAGHTSVPNQILDGLLPLLKVQEQAVYLRLYRLSHGFKTDTCRVGFEKLAATCNLSRRATIRSVEKLESVGLVERLGCDFKARNIEKGNLYRVNLPKIESAPQTLSARQALSVSQALSAAQSPNKDHDDDLKNDHHQSETMRLYQTITGNEWKKSDENAYRQLAGLPIEQIETGIRQINQRAANRPGSLNYFVKGLLEAAKKAPMPESGVESPRAIQKRVLEAAIIGVRQAHVGTGLTRGELAAAVKEVCLAEGISWSDDLFEEIIR